MRTPKNKSTLENYLLKGVLTSEGVNGTKVADGGALLWCCNWSKNEKFRNIFQKFVNKCFSEKFDIVVFDGYTSSTKDVTRKSRSTKTAQTIEIDDDNVCTYDRNDFLTNYTNKEMFVTILATKLEEIGIKVICCPCDADTIIVKTALECQSKPVTVFSDDTDILCILLHHLQFTGINASDVLLKNMTTQNRHRN